MMNNMTTRNFGKRPIRRNKNLKVVRNRFARPLAVSNAAYGPKTLDSVMRGLTTASRNLQSKTYENAYQMCRLSPWTMNPSFSGIPDGSNSRRIIVDHKSFTDMSFTSAGNCTIRISPSLPYGALMTMSSGLTFSLTNLGSTIGGTFGTAFIDAFVPICIYPEYKDDLNILAAKSGPYAQSKVRLVGQAWRLVYTGAATTASGIVTVRSFPITAGVNMGVNYAQKCNTGNTAVAGTFTGNNIILAHGIDFPPVSSAYPGDSVIFRPENNVHGILKNDASVYPWKDYFEQPYTMYDINRYKFADIVNSSSTAPVQLCLTQGIGGQNLGTNAMSDNFSMTEINVAFSAVPTSFRLEVKACWEYLVQPSSVMASLTRAPPKPDLAVINKVQEAVARSPLAAPSTQTVTGQMQGRPTQR